MSFTLSTFLYINIFLLVMLAIFFQALDQIIVISDPALTLSVLDFMCLAYAFYTVYDFMFWLTGRKMPKKKKSSE